MTGLGHQIAATGAALFLALPHLEAGLIPKAGTLFLSCAGAGKAPDWLELPWNGRRLIPHRRITHWVLGWAIVLAYASTMLQGFASWALVGFSLGCLIHLSGDMLTPRGVPVIHPWARTKGAKLTSGSEDEWIWIFAVWSLAFLIYKHGSLDGVQHFIEATKETLHVTSS